MDNVSVIKVPERRIVSLRSKDGTTLITAKKYSHTISISLDMVRAGGVVRPTEFITSPEDLMEFVVAVYDELAEEKPK